MALTCDKYSALPYMSMVLLTVTYLANSIGMIRAEAI